MKHTIIIFSLLVSTFVYAQKTDKYIKEKDVTRIIQTLAADDMNGRSAMDEKSIFKAATFIEKEFKSIGLKPMPGATGFLQEFTKDKMVAGGEVVIDNEKIADDHVIIVTEKMQATITGGLTIKNISVDNSVQNKDQYFFEKAFGAARDTASSLVLIAPEFEKNFQEFKAYFKQRFASGRKGLKAFVLGKTTASSYSVVAKQKIEKVRMANVVGMLEGKTKKDEMVVFGGHYDHLGKRDTVIYYGADDDGSGTTSVLELASAFAKAEAAGKGPRRSIVFMTVSGEEKGLWGSEYYTDHPVFPLDKTTVDLNIDMVGRIDGTRKQGDSTNYVYVVGDDKVSSDLKVISEAINKKYTKVELDYKFNDPKDPQRIYFRSDHYNFAKHGVPIIFYYDGMLDADYHKPTDTPDKINYELMVKRDRLIFHTAWEMANRNDMLKRDIPLEVPKAF